MSGNNVPLPDMADIRLSKDIQEQDERIKNLAADTALKLQSLANANIQLFLAIATVVAALGGVIVGGAALYLDHKQDPHPPSTFIFLNPGPDIML
jgi:hypothetical protein